MRPRRLVELPLGAVLAIPLFVGEEPDTRRLRADALEGRGDEFGYARVVADLGGAGFLVEVFDLVGPLDAEPEAVVRAGRLLDPVVVSGLAVHTRRWRVLGTPPGYDPERDSRLSEVRLVIGAGDDLRLWHGGTREETPIAAADAEAYEDWTIWSPSQLERRIGDALARR